MTPTQYKESAQATSSLTQEPTPELVSRVKNLPALTALQRALSQIAEHGADVEGLKKFMFYNKPFNVADFTNADADNAATILKTAKDIRILHGIIGIISEVGELAEIAISWLFEDGEIQVDGKGGLMEEVGDLQWYEEELFAAIGTTREKVWEMNVAKLQKRYGGGAFNEKNAIHRDEAAEDKVLRGPGSSRDDLSN